MSQDLNVRRKADKHQRVLFLVQAVPTNDIFFAV